MKTQSTNREAEYRPDVYSLVRSLFCDHPKVKAGYHIAHASNHPRKNLLYKKNKVHYFTIHIYNPPCMCHPDLFMPGYSNASPMLM
jgi:hypothetical protein